MGVSQMSANGTKPAGVDAAVAMRELNDQQSGAFWKWGNGSRNSCSTLAGVS